jgi:hypothetical protein
MSIHLLLYHLRDHDERHAKPETFHRTIHATVTDKEVCPRKHFQLWHMWRDQKVGRWLFEGSGIDACAKGKHDLPLGLSKSIKAHLIEIHWLAICQVFCFAGSYVVKAACCMPFTPNSPESLIALAQNTVT